MHATDFGRTLIIANPAAQSGAAREVAERLQRFLDMAARASQFDLVLTERMGHAKELAAQATGYRTVIALGGDGVIHEVVNGLMTQKEDARPALAVLPVGSGNDFAQTLGIDDFSGRDFGALLTCELQRQDIGRIRSWNPASGSGEAVVERLTRRPVWSALTKLHYNPGSWWTAFADIFGGGLILITLTGLVIVKGPKGLRGRGGVELAAGILLPLLFLLI